MPKRYIKLPDGRIIEDSGAPVDSSLTVPGAAADAAVAGKKFGELSEAKVDIQQGTKNAGKLLYVGADGVVTVLMLGNGLKIENGVLMVTNAVVASAICGEFLCGEALCGGAN